MPAAVSSMLNAMQSLEVAVRPNQSDCCASVLTHNLGSSDTWHGLPNYIFVIFILSSFIFCYLKYRSITDKAKGAVCESCIHIIQCFSCELFSILLSSVKFIID